MPLHTRVGGGQVQAVLSGFFATDFAILSRVISGYLINNFWSYQF